MTAPRGGWLGRRPIISLEHYVALRALGVVRRGKRDASKDSISAYARAHGINPNSARYAALRGIKRYDVLARANT